MSNVKLVPHPSVRLKYTFLDPDGTRYKKCKVCGEIKLETKENFKKVREFCHAVCLVCFNKARKEAYTLESKKKLELGRVGDLVWYDLTKKNHYVDSNGVFYKKCCKCRKIKKENEYYQCIRKQKDGTKYKSLRDYCIDCVLILKREYCIENRDKIIKMRQTEEFKIKRREAKKKRLREDPVYKLRESISNTVNKAFKKFGSNKVGNSILKYLNYEITALRDHLESQFDEHMTWENHGTYWHLDHIIPQSDLPYLSMEDDNFKKCWALDNLRPLEARQNVLDGIHRVRHKSKRK